MPSRHQIWGYSKRPHFLDCDEAFVKQCCSMQMCIYSSPNPLLITSSWPGCPLFTCSRLVRVQMAAWNPLSLSVSAAQWFIAVSSDFHLLFFCVLEVSASTGCTLLLLTSLCMGVHKPVGFFSKLPTLLPQCLNCPVALMLSFQNHYH